MDLSKLSNEEYGRYVGEKEKTSPLWKDLIWAFCVGGLICVGGQALSELYQSWGLSKDDAGTWVSITLVFLAALLTGLGVFDDIARRAGAGTLVPITGFANAMVSPALEFKSEGLILGTGARLFTVAGPVLAYGIGAGHRLRDGGQRDLRADPVGDGTVLTGHGVVEGGATAK